ncbi:Tyrosine-protein kinase Btk29A, partial [Melipona quadrifasciata]
RWSYRRFVCAVCSENPGLSGRYHAGLWSGKRWSCCRLSTRSAEGCDTCSSWSSKPLNATNPSSTSTSSFTSAAGSTVATTVAITDRPQTTNSEANNNPIVHSQARSTIGSYQTQIFFSLPRLLPPLFLQSTLLLLGPLAPRKRKKRVTSESALLAGDHSNTRRSFFPREERSVQLGSDTMKLCIITYFKIGGFARCVCSAEIKFVSFDFLSSFLCLFNLAALGKTRVVHVRS